MGLGCGGPSRLGQRQDRSFEQSVSLVRRALALGINFFDTAEAYGTERILGRALRGVPRDSVVISTKKSYKQGISPSLLRAGLEESLRKLGTDYVDIYSLHGVEPWDYPRLRDHILPTFYDMRAEGKIRFIGVSESFTKDRRHTMLRDSLHDDPWDVVLVAFNILNQTARHTVLPLTVSNNVAVQAMYAVRRAFSHPDKLVEDLRVLAKARQIELSETEMSNPLGFVLEESDAQSLVEAAYRFCRHEPGIQVVLAGTGSEEHLIANAASICRPPLPDAVASRLKLMFRKADLVTGG